MVSDLTGSEIDTILYQKGVGVLSIGESEYGYSFPISFGYDCDHMYFPVVSAEDSKKEELISDGIGATFVVFSVTPEESVIVSGQLHQVKSKQYKNKAIEAISDNANITSYEMIPNQESAEFKYYRLEIEEISGREFESSF